MASVQCHKNRPHDWSFIGGRGRLRPGPVRQVRPRRTNRCVVPGGVGCWPTASVARWSPVVAQDVRRTSGYGHDHHDGSKFDHHRWLDLVERPRRDGHPDLRGVHLVEDGSVGRLLRRARARGWTPTSTMTNAQGGINGRKVVLTADLDDGGSPTQFTQQVHTAIDQDHVFAVGVASAWFTPNYFVATKTPTYGYNVSANWDTAPNLFAAGGSTQSTRRASPRSGMSSSRRSRSRSPSSATARRSPPPTTPATPSPRS